MLHVYTLRRTHIDIVGDDGGFTDGRREETAKPAGAEGKSDGSTFVKQRAASVTHEQSVNKAFKVLGITGGHYRETI
jgi:hypothetical protein